MILLLGNMVLSSVYSKSFVLGLQQYQEVGVP